MNLIPTKFFLLTAGIAAVLLFAAGAIVQIQRLQLNLKDKDIQALVIERNNANNALISCNNQQKINHEASDAYQKDNTHLRRRNADLKRMLDDIPDQCVPIQRATGGPDAAKDGKFSGSRGVMASALVDLGTECDEVRAQLTALQGWIIDTGNNLKE